MIKIAAFDLTVANLLLAPFKVPLKSYVGKDVQADREAHFFVIQSTCKNTWDSKPLLIFQYIVNTIVGEWLACRILGPLLGLELIMTGYYLILLCVFAVLTAINYSKLGASSA